MQLWGGKVGLEIDLRIDVWIKVCIQERKHWTSMRERGDGRWERGEGRGERRTQGLNSV